MVNKIMKMYSPETWTIKTRKTKNQEHRLLVSSRQTLEELFTISSKNEAKYIIYSTYKPQKNQSFVKIKPRMMSTKLWTDYDKVHAKIRL